MPPTTKKGAYVDGLIAYIIDTVDPPRPVFGERIKLNPLTKWPDRIWLVISVTMARHLINIPEKIITARNPEGLVHFLASHPAWDHTIQKALYKVGFRIDYSKMPTQGLSLVERKEEA